MRDRRTISISIILSLMLLLAGCAQRVQIHEVKSPVAGTKTHVSATKAQLPEGFVYIKEYIPSAQIDIRYYGNNNFTGRPVAGYLAPKAILTREAARALQNISAELAEQGYALKIFDAYRPQKAVNDFIQWTCSSGNEEMKADYYPHINKKDLCWLGYIAIRSGHSRGSTVDLTLVDKKTGKEIDMGGGFDLLDPISTHGSPLITPTQAANRAILKKAMLSNGFYAYSGEWWHYTLANEPYPDRYFDFDVR